MKWFAYGTAVTSLILITGLVLPLAEGLFFNPEGGFSVGGVHISVDQNEATVSPGETALFNITVANDSELPVLINATIISLSRWKTTLDPGFMILAPHKVASMVIYMTAPDDAANGTNAKITIVYAISFPETGETVDIPATTIETVVEDGGSSPNYLGMIVVASIGIGLAAFLSTDKGQYLGSLALGPLYTRIHKDNILNNEIRNGIFTYIRENPGHNYSEIKKKLDLNNGALSHHLKTLEREHYIKSRKNGLYRRFFLRNQPIPNIILNKPQKKILRFLIKQPGVAQSSIAQDLGVSRQTVNYHILIMEQMGAVKVERQGKRALCYPLVKPSPVPLDHGYAK